MSSANSSPARDDAPTVVIDNGTGATTIHGIELPGSPSVRANLRPDGRVHVTATWETTDLTVVPAPETEITINVPPAPTPEQAYEAQMAAIRSAHDPRRG